MMKKSETDQSEFNGKVNIFKGTMVIIAVLTLVLVGLNYSDKVEAVDVIGEPLLSAKFGLVIDDVSAGYFTECTGIGSETEVVEYKVVDQSGEIIQKLPGRLRWHDVVLKRAITSNMDLWTWRKQVEDGDIDNAQKNISIVLYDQTMQPIAGWELTNGWLSDINTSIDSDGMVQEEVILVCEGEERIN